MGLLLLLLIIAVKVLINLWLLTLTKDYYILYYTYYTIRIRFGNPNKLSYLKECI